MRPEWGLTLPPAGKLQRRSLDGWKSCGVAPILGAITRWRGAATCGQGQQGGAAREQEERAAARVSGEGAERLGGGVPTLAPPSPSPPSLRPGERRPEGGLEGFVEKARLARACRVSISGDLLQ